MTFILADRVVESSATTGSGAFTLAGAYTGYRAFSAVCATSDTVPYMIVAVDSNGNPSGDWEVGVGTYSGANTLTRTTVQASSNANAAVNFAAGAKRVILGPTAGFFNGDFIKPIECFAIAISDEITPIATGTAKATFRMPYAFTLTAVRASLTTASSSGTPTFDINEGGSSILSTKLTIDASEKTSVTAATAAVISDANLADDAEITIDIDTAGTNATGAKIYLIGRRA